VRKDIGGKVMQPGEGADKWGGGRQVSKTFERGLLKCMDDGKREWQLTARNGEEKGGGREKGKCLAK